MSEKEDIQRQFEHSIKGVAANMASEYIDLGYSVHDYTTEMQNLVKNRDKALKGLQVTVERRHLQALANALQHGKGCVCFGKQERSRKCTPYIDDKVCVACKAITPLLKDDC